MRSVRKPHRAISSPGSGARWRFCEIQYLKTTITDQQREGFSRIVEATVSHIEAGELLSHSGPLLFAIR